MGYHTLPSIRDYWSRDLGLGVKVVSDVMLRDRFFEIRAALHFVDNEIPQDKNDKAWKIRSIINHFNQAFSQAMDPTSEQAINEHMIKFKGQHSMKQYMPLKSIKRGFTVRYGAEMIRPLITFFSLTFIPEKRKTEKVD